MSLNLSCFYYHTGKCAKYEFTCANGKCLDKWRRCLDGDDCGDGSDEQQCRKFVITVTVVQIVQSPFLWADGSLFKLCCGNQVEIQTNIGSCLSSFSLFNESNN